MKYALAREYSMLRMRAISVSAAILALTSIPLLGRTTPKTTPLGIVINAEHAHVGEASADVGTTIYSGDRVSTDLQGSMQLRAGAARLLLPSSSAAFVDENDGAPSAKLLMGNATFSTGNARAFTLYASKAAIRPQTDVPTIGQVTYLSEKELLVTARRGGLTVTVEDETKVINEGESYRVLLDSSAEAAQEPAGAGSGNQGPTRGGGPPLRAGRSRFLIITVSLTAIGTGIAIYYALESPSRP
jgi:hypothetical protein